MKLKALVTAELVRPMLDPLADRIDFDFAGYSIDHVVMPRDELKRRVADVDILVCEYDTIDAEIFDAAHPCGHPAVQLPPSARGRNVFRDGEVFKVTHPSDVEIAELMLKRRNE